MANLRCKPARDPLQCIVPEFRELSSTNGLKLDQSFYPPPFSVLFRPLSMAHALSGINVACTPQQT